MEGDAAEEFGPLPGNGLVLHRIAYTMHLGSAEKAGRFAGTRVVTDRPRALEAWPALDWLRWVMCFGTSSSASA